MKVDRENLEREIEKIKKEITLKDTPESRETVGDLYFQLYKLYGLKYQQCTDSWERNVYKEKRIDALYQALLRYFLNESVSKMAYLTLIIEKEGYLGFSSKLDWLYERITTEMDQVQKVRSALEENSLYEQIKEINELENIKTEILSSGKSTKLDLAYQAFNQAQALEIEGVPRKQVADQYVKAIEILEGEESFEAKTLKKSCYEKAITRYLLTDHIDETLSLVKKAEKEGIKLKPTLKEKALQKYRIIQSYREGKRPILMLLQNELINCENELEMIEKILSEGDKLSLEEDIDFNVEKIWKYDLIRGLTEIESEKVIGTLPKLSLYNIILALYDYFRDGLAVVKFTREETKGMMVIPLSDFSKIQTIEYVFHYAFKQ